MSQFVHGTNIDNKIKKVKNPKNKKLLQEIKQRCDKWKKKNLEITGISKSDIEGKTRLLNNYKNFIDQPKFKKEKGRTTGFIHQDKLHSTVIEEFLYYLFKDIRRLKNKYINFGPTEAYSNLYFAPRNIDAFEKSSNIVINVKNQDFSISKEVILKSKVSNNENWQEKKIYVPMVSIESKRYLDKTMFEGSVATAEKIKKGNPYCIFLIVTETYEVSSEVEPRLSSIDQIYVLRKQKKGKNKHLNPICPDIVYDLFGFVKTHIDSEWYNVQERIQKGKMI